MPIVLADGVRLYYELYGPADGAVLVLSNGIFATTASWAYQKAALARRFRLLLYDCRGQGQSEHPAGPYSMEQHAADLKALLHALGIAQAHIGGISYGAAVSLLFAARYPAATRSVIAVSAAERADERLRAAVAAWRAACAAADGDALFRLAVESNFTPQWVAGHRAFVQSTRQYYRALDMPAAVRLIDSFLRSDISAVLPQIGAPALIISAAGDSLHTPEQAALLARHIPQADLIVIPDAGHMLIWEKPVAVTTALLDFLTGQSP